MAWQSATTLSTASAGASFFRRKMTTWTVDGSLSAPSDGLIGSILGGSAATAAADRAAAAASAAANDRMRDMRILLGAKKVTDSGAQANRPPGGMQPPAGRRAPAVVQS